MIKHAKKFDVCEYSEHAFVKAAVRLGTVSDLRKIIMGFGGDYFYILPGLLELYGDKELPDDTKNGAKRTFFDAVLDAYLMKAKKDQIQEPLELLRDEIKQRITNPFKPNFYDLKNPISDIPASDPVRSRRVLEKLEKFMAEFLSFSGKDG